MDAYACTYTKEMMAWDLPEISHCTLSRLSSNSHFCDKKVFFCKCGVDYGIIFAVIKQEVEEQNQAGGGWWIDTWLEWEERN